MFGVYRIRFAEGLHGLANGPEQLLCPGPGDRHVAALVQLGVAPLSPSLRHVEGNHVAQLEHRDAAHAEPPPAP